MQNNKPYSIRMSAAPTCTTAFDPLTSSTCPLRWLPSWSVSRTISANFGNWQQQKKIQHHWSFHEQRMSSFQWTKWTQKRYLFFG